ncbi:hypothetical protein AC629_33380 [Bradyrhizobium sp. NAS80.1]|nr:hypothetical protein AC629_33380 [Bradyrhizobium sp. NAS80.1]
MRAAHRVERGWLVSEAWYYADYNGQVGPTTLEALKTALARSSEPENVLVWRHGFTGWVRAGDVPELSPQTSRPPELPTDQMPTWRVKWWWYPIPFISLGIGSQVGRKVMIWNSAQRRKRKQKRKAMQV